MHETLTPQSLDRFAGSRPPQLGIIGGGQLARMTGIAALRLGCDILVLEKSADSPAARLARRSITGDWDDEVTVVGFAAEADVVAIENEFVASSSLEAIARAGHRVYPTAGTMELVQDKLRQKETLRAAGIAVPAFAATPDLAALERVGASFGFPFVLKARRNGYDGRGNATVRSAGDLKSGWQTLGGDRGNALYAEAFCPFVRELAVIVTRGRDGGIATYPAVETVQKNHVCHVVRAPAPVSDEIASRAMDLARRAIIAVNGVGSWGVEMFLTADGSLLINELAPRVHNSGHYTIEACVCSQFENHVRALFGWPLGSTAMTAPAAVMVNLLGTEPGPGLPAGLSDALAVPGAHVHIYGKAVTTPGRKMGHITVLADTLAEAEKLASQSSAALKFSHA
jgi:5-(carboxyamino)imidazole ribonucleotide synthase